MGKGEIFENIFYLMRHHFVILWRRWSIGSLHGVLLLLLLLRLLLLLLMLLLHLHHHLGVHVGTHTGMTHHASIHVHLVGTHAHAHVVSHLHALLLLLHHHLLLLHITDT